MAPHEDRDWLPIAEQASTEMDPEKLMILVAQLCQALEERAERARLQQRTGIAGGSLPAGTQLSA